MTDTLASQQPTGAEKPAAITDHSSGIEAPNFEQLTSALTALPTDCDDFTFNFHRMAPMANTAAEVPEIADRLYQLAKDWASGNLGGVLSKKWVTLGSNGLTREQYFDRTWNRFLKGKFSGKKATLATIFWHAKQAGWVWNYQNSTNDDGEVSV